jgi:hypothetical protein
MTLGSKSIAGLHRFYFFTIFESGEPGEFPVSAERLKIVLLIMDLRCDNSVEAVEFPIRAAILSVHGKDVFLVFF